MKTPTILLTLAAGTAIAAPEPLDFLPVFNGKDLSGWSGDGHSVENETIVSSSTGGVLRSDLRFANFILDFEFRLESGAGGGLAFHYLGSGDPDTAGMEIPILDNTSESFSGLDAEQLHGALKGLEPAKKGALKPVGEWNLQRVVVNAGEVKVELNGHRIMSADLDRLAEKHPDHAGLHRRAGHIALVGRGAGVSYRALRICEIPPAANVQGVREAGFRPLSEDGLRAWKQASGSERHWAAINGIIKYDGRRSEGVDLDLWTRDSFGDLTLVFDWRWSGTGPAMNRPVIGADGNETGETREVEELDSGIYLRGSSKAQVNLWNWPAGSGELYGYRSDTAQPAEVRAAAVPAKKADKPLGEWNRTMITLKGDRVTVLLNDELVIDGATLPGVPSEGPVGLQHHGSRIDFANIWIRED